MGSDSASLACAVPENIIPAGGRLSESRGVLDFNMSVLLLSFFLSSDSENDNGRLKSAADLEV